MKSFREQMAADFANVFLNTEEFGRACDWNGHPLLIAEDATLEQQAFGMNGVNRNQKRVLCRDTDLKPAPKVTEQVQFDGEWWNVVDVKNPIAHLVITMERMSA